MPKCSTSSSFQSESSFRNGYCLWSWDGAKWILWSCHCRTPGYECEDPNTGAGAGGDYYGDLRKFPCVSEGP